jgi:large subunit ribosomal protein L29
MTSNTELREMSDEQLQATADDSARELFRLRFESQSERLSTPSDMRKHRRLIARIKTIQTERAKAAANTTQAEA